MKLKELLIEKITESAVSFPYIIAEAGVNHECDMDLAKRLIDEAQEGGAHAIKFQSYKAETIASKHAAAYWDLSQEPSTSQYELFKKHDKFWKNEFEILKKYCDAVGIEFLSTPFDLESASFLNDLVDVFKISSSDITNKPFIEYICHFKKPIILSTGAADFNEIFEAVSWIKTYSIPLALLHCILNYPTKDENANLGMMVTLKQKFAECTIGYSDHTLPKNMKTLEVATLLGARIIEKHFTYDKTLPGNDHYHAMDKNDLRTFCENIKNILQLIGKYEISALATEAPARQHARRSLVAKRFIAKGKKIGLDDLTWKRPALGISPKYIADVIGKICLADIQADDILQWDLMK